MYSNLNINHLPVYITFKENPGEVYQYRENYNHNLYFHVFIIENRDK